jgi:hypothetical protein
LPEPWIDLGQSLQPPHGGAGRNLSVHIGVDFGSAYTKLALRFADKVFPVAWDGLSGARVPFFLAGEISRMSNGDLLVGRAPSASETKSGIKLPFLRSDPTLEARASAVAFLAWVLRYARAWLFKEYGGMLRGRRLAWNLAIGCPTDAIESKGLVETYLHLASAGWLLSRSTRRFGMDSALRALEVARADSESAQLDSLGVVPEFVAQIAGYARSSQRQRGLHFLVDVGAGTLDLATFNVEKDPNDRTRDHFPILHSAVELLGTHLLMEARNRKLGGMLPWNDAGRVPSTEEIAAQMPKHSAAVHAADAAFGRELQTHIGRVIQITKGRRSPLSPAWREGLPVFMAGGGSSCDLYRRAVLATCSDLAVRPISLPLAVGDDNKQSRIERSDLHRLSVAYGLTSDSSLLARITASGDIENFVLTRSERQRPDRDDLYAK